ncbi:hypothetical protein GGR54DRAFT_478077 [Hypoxylon sp. NC1633]|nr:hypothetical protein GGR54DRAFT_478077 [Hypoxylon sp. NC1633]
MTACLVLQTTSFVIITSSRHLLLRSLQILYISSFFWIHRIQCIVDLDPFESAIALGILALLLPIFVTQPHWTGVAHAAHGVVDPRLA